MHYVKRLFDGSTLGLEYLDRDKKKINAFRIGPQCGMHNLGPEIVLYYGVVASICMSGG